MAAGLSSEAKRSRVRRFFNKQTREIHQKYVNADVKRTGSKRLTVLGPQGSFDIEVRWGAFSNGESIGTVYVNGAPYFDGFSGILEQEGKRIGLEAFQK